MIVPTATK